MTRLRFSPATAIALVALFLALGGGSFAIASLSSGDKTVIRRIANSRITARAPGLSVKHAKAVASAANANKLDGLDSSAIAAGRIHVDGTGPATFPDTPIVPDLSFELDCYEDHLQFVPVIDEPGTANAMIVASGVEYVAFDPGDFFVNIDNGAHDYHAESKSRMDGRQDVQFFLKDTSGTARALARIIIDSGSHTYSIALVLFHVSGANPSCRAFGTAVPTG
jgi:hypothetical protein